MATSLIPTTTIEQLKEYRRREHRRATAILMAEVKSLLEIFPTKPTAVLVRVALENPDVAIEYDRAKAKAESIGKTIRKRKRRVAAENLIY